MSILVNKLAIVMLETDR